MAKIPLSDGRTAVVDDADLRLVAGRRWHAARRNNLIYAVGSAGKPLMHRLILGLKLGDPHVDHRDGDGLNNRRSNLRLATQLQNTGNRQNYRPSGSSRFKGVGWSKVSSKWRAYIGKRGEHLGLFEDEEEAARAYDQAARERYGEFAVLNFPEGRDV